MNLRKPQMIVARPMGIEAGLQVSQTLAFCDLCMKHGTQLCPAGKPAHANVSSERANLFLEERSGQKGCQLSKHCITMCHGLGLLFMGSAFACFPMVHSGVREPKPVLASTRRGIETLRITQLQKHVPDPGVPRSKKCASSYCVRRYRFRGRTKTAVIHDRQPDSTEVQNDKP